MTKAKTLEEIIWVACMDADVGESMVDPTNKKAIAEAKAAIMALVPKKKDISRLSDDEYREASSFNDAIDATLEAFGAGHD